MNLYPYLPLSAARSRANECASLSRGQLLERSSDWDESAIYPPIGGERVDRPEIRRLQAAVRSRMHDAEASSETSAGAYRKFDEAVAPLLLRDMDISPHEASQTALWAFLACVVLPDVVRWRFPGDDASGTNPRRFLGGARGIRNVLGRLWWRAFVLMDPAAVDPWQLVRAVGEDQAVQLLERPFLSGNPPLARAILRAAITSGSSQQQDAVRQVTLRLMRVAGVVPLEALPEPALEAVVFREFASTLRALTSPGTLVSGEGATSVPPITMNDAAGPGGRTGPGSQEGPPPTGAELSATPEPSVHPRTATPHVAALQARIGPEQLEVGPMQGMIVVPDSIAAVLPPLDESFANPDRNVIAVDPESHRWMWQYVHYNRSRQGRRFAGLAAFLAKHDARPGDVLHLVIETDGTIAARIVHSNAPSGGG